ncbi:hypothetical protein CDD81_2327 [Ophiocordyceps australis]|uniref:Phosphatidylserine decarboxylase n=1 Tax=Ophiocordyceps australis TaxID=1399860 RepID=A0A2C5XES5_9HYPO|nr:hypothetical protein CDD81_2327 [Ophiocordyceps australis]
MAYTALVQHLADTVDKDSALLQAFNSAIASSKQAAPDTYADIETFADFLGFMDMFVTWVPRANPDVRVVDDVMHLLGKFHFVFDQDELRRLSQTWTTAGNVKEPIPWLAEWLVLYSRQMGVFMDSRQSLTKESLQTFCRRQDYHMEDYIEPPEGWSSFNHFFARHIKPEARPIHGMADDTIVVSPADSCFAGSWPVDKDGYIELKHARWNVRTLLRGSKYQNDFDGGVFTHSFLNVNDYHRLHAPVAGKVLETMKMAGEVYLEVTVKDKKNVYTNVHVGSVPGELGVLDGEDHQWFQMRGLLILDSPIGLVAVIAVGMAQIASVMITAQEGRQLHKGEEICYFQFGGSDVVLVFQKNSNVGFTAQVTTPPAHYKVGQKIAQARPEARSSIIM